MKEVTTKLYRYSELGLYAENGMFEYERSFLYRVIPIEDVWFTSGGSIYAIFNT